MKRFAWVGLLALALMAAAPAGASTFLAMDQDQLLAQSDAVIQGRVLKVSSFWSPSGRLILTEALIQVEETIAGGAPSVVIVRTAGGTVGGYTVEAHGFPKFAVDDRLVLFIHGNANAGEVTGYGQGQYRVVRDKAGVEMALPTIGDGVRLLHGDGRPAAAPKAERLDAFKERIRAAQEARDRRLEN